MSILFTAAQITAFHDAACANPAWPAQTVSPPAAHAVWEWVVKNHRNNCLLWDEEDLARRTQARPEDIMANKRAIDGYNQARNDATERVDEYLLISLGLVSEASAQSVAPTANVTSAARLNSETAGSMADRLSIMALKIKAMRLQTQRQDVSSDFIANCQAKLERLLEQRQDLSHCLDALLNDCAAGKAYFKVYRQFKMYNDASLNPQLVKEAQGKAGA